MLVRQMCWKRRLGGRAWMKLFTPEELVVCKTPGHAGHNPLENIEVVVEVVRHVYETFVRDLFIPRNSFHIILLVRISLPHHIILLELFDWISYLGSCLSGFCTSSTPLSLGLSPVSSVRYDLPASKFLSTASFGSILLVTHGLMAHFFC